MTLSANMPNDLDTFLNTDDFGVVALYNGATNIDVLFDNPYFENEETGAETREPELECKTSDISGIAHGTTFVIDGVTYYAINPKPDLTDLMTRVALSKINPNG